MSLLFSDRVVISGSWDGGPCLALCSTWSMLGTCVSSLHVRSFSFSLSFSLSRICKYILTKENKRREKEKQGGEEKRRREWRGGEVSVGGEGREKKQSIGTLLHPHRVA